MSLNTLVAGSSTESYVNLEEANAYVASRPDSKNWNNVDYAERERVLRQATIDIDLFRFKGTRLFEGGESTIIPNISATSAYDFFNYGNQRLQFPRSWHEYYTAYPDSGTTETLVDGSFASSTFQREYDYFNFGAIYILKGTNKGLSREIEDYNASSGTFTFTTAFPNSIDTTSQFLLLAPIDRYVKYATIEQAVFLTDNLELRQHMQWKDAGIVARSIGDVSIRFGSPGGSMDRIGGFFSSNAFRYIQKFIDKSKNTGRN